MKYTIDCTGWNREKFIDIFSELSDNTNAKIKVSCKKGTYIRSLIDDIGKKLGCGAYMSDLIRTRAGNFVLEKSDELNSDKFFQINPLDVINLYKLALNEIEYNKIMNGNFIKNTTGKSQGIILLTKDNKLVSIANLSDNLIMPKKNFKED